MARAVLKLAPQGNRRAADVIHSLGLAVRDIAPAFAEG
jgi:hypothetical protein